MKNQGSEGQITVPVELNIMVGGEAGQGVQSVGFLLAKSFARAGYHVFADQDYESRVRGGHNFYRIRASDNPVNAIREAVDILIAMDVPSIELHRGELSPSGVVICDRDKAAVPRFSSVLAVPLERLAVERTGSKLVANTVALGAALGCVGFDFTVMAGVLKEFFSTGKTGEDNVTAARAGYDLAVRERAGHLPRIVPISGNARRMLINGNEAIALGAIAAGCRYMAGYPMTPVTPIMEYYAGKAREFGLAFVPLEDEIAVINSVVGAAYAGARAMTATSGGGFCLMVEALSLAGMTETPMVVVLGQRPGPAIGLPTRTEQGELEFAIHAGHGEFPRAVFAPATIEDCFWLTVNAFNLAEKYQIPVIIMTDHVLGTSYYTAEKFDLSKVVIDRGELFDKKDTEAIAAYRRHAVTRSGISPRAFPLQSEGIIIATDSDEHDEAGHLIEDAETRVQMMDKRMRKIDGLKRDIVLPRRWGPEKADILLIGWGSTLGALIEAVRMLEADGASVNLLHLNQLWPFPSETVMKALDSCRTSCVVENNSTGQLAHLIAAETGRKITGRILRYDGRPFTPAGIANEVKKAQR